jgi:hypothetical protein
MYQQKWKSPLRPQALDLVEAVAAVAFAAAPLSRTSAAEGLDVVLVAPAPSSGFAKGYSKVRQKSASKKDR